VLWILWRRRHKLFGSPTDPFVASTRATFGFLYLDYGSSAWWWEVEELLRKLLLSAVVVLIEEGSPLQVTLAVLVSGWAHVLHAQYKPWGGGSVLYSLQHGALFVTSFVFLMGLLFKVDGVSPSSPTYSALSGVMVTLCSAFAAAWVAVIVARVFSMWRSVRSSRKSRALVRTGGAGGGRGAWLDDNINDSARGGAPVQVVGDAASSVGDAADATAQASGFLVENPLRRPARPADGYNVSARASSASDAAVVGDAAVEHVTGGAVALQPGLPPPLPASTAVQRLQRVLAAQRPVQSTRLGDSEPSKEGSPSAERRGV
jgi:hypothetical protein